MPRFFCVVAMPSFSFIIPVKPGGSVTALEALRRLDASSYPFEVLLAEGCRPSRQRNMAVNQAEGDVVYFLDDDSRITPAGLAACAVAMADKGVAVAGGPSITPRDDSSLQRLFGAALASPFGSGGMRNRYRVVGSVRETSDRELILCNLAMRRDVFMASGGLDERLYPNEENELLDRIRSNGAKLLHVPEMAVVRSQRRTLRQFVRQMFSYGRGRAQQTLIAGPGSPVSFAPLLFLFYLVLLPWLSRTFAGLLPLGLYLAMDIVFSLTAAVASGSLARLWLLFLFPLMHCANGWGLLYGLCGGKQGISGNVPTPVTVTRLKGFAQTVW